MLAPWLNGFDDLLREGTAVGTEFLYGDAKHLPRPVHYADERVGLMKLHVSISVTVLSSDQDAAYACPSREIAEVLLVGILRVELVSRIVATYALGL